MASRLLTAALTAAGLALGATPALALSPAPPPPQELDIGTAAALTYGLPLVISGAGALALSPLAGNPNLALALGVPIQLAALGSLASGYVYAGEPWRGATMLAAEGGVLMASSALSFGIAALLWGGGQSAGIGGALVAISVVGARWIGFNVYKMMDLNMIIEQKNRQRRGYSGKLKAGSA